MRTSESNVVDAILERGEPILIGEEQYEIAPPTIATLILVSELVAKIPEVKVSDEPEDILNETLRVAKDCHVLGEIPAVLILGAKGLTKEVEETELSFFGFVRKKRVRIIDRKKELSDFLLKNLSVTQLGELTVGLLRRMQVSDFFAYTTSLYEINLLKPTREVETIASGRQ